jgi:hypothetical protein
MERVNTLMQVAEGPALDQIAERDGRVEVKGA